VPGPTPSRRMIVTRIIGLGLALLPMCHVKDAATQLDRFGRRVLRSRRLAAYALAGVERECRRTLLRLTDDRRVPLPSALISGLRVAGSEGEPRLVLKRPELSRVAVEAHFERTGLCIDIPTLPTRLARTAASRILDIRQVLNTSVGRKILRPTAASAK